MFQRRHFVFTFFLVSGCILSTFPAIGRSQTRSAVPLNPQDKLEKNPFFKEILEHQENPKMVEKAKIAYLINAIKKSPYKFIRNGAEHSGFKASTHMLMKYRRVSDRIENAEEFIMGLATRSSVSGEPYLIKLSDGEIIPTKDALFEELAYLETQIKEHTPAQTPDSSLDDPSHS